MKMEKRRFDFFSVIFGLIGVLAAAAGIWLALNNQTASPVLVEQPAAARSRIVVLMDALCARDYDSLSASLYGNPDLGLSREAEDEVGQLIWNAVAQSYQYELEDGFHATDSGVAMDVVITAMDMNSVTANLRTRAQSLLEQRVQETENPDQVYDEDGEYREDFVMEVLYDAVEEAMAEDAATITWEVTLNLVYENDRWWIMPEEELLKAISGGILG